MTIIKQLQDRKKAGRVTYGVVMEWFRNIWLRGKIGYWVLDNIELTKNKKKICRNKKKVVPLQKNINQFIVVTK